MTEPGFLQESGGDRDSPREQLLHEMLTDVRADDVVPTVAVVAARAGIAPDLARALFPDATQLAETCLDFVLAGTSELRDVAIGVHGAGIAPLRALLRVIGEVVDSYRPLVEKVPDAPAWGEMRQLVVDMLEAAGGEICSVDTKVVSEVLTRAALRGEDGEQEWGAALDVLMAGRPQANTP